MMRIAQAAILTIVTMIAVPASKAEQSLPPPPPIAHPPSAHPIYSTYPTVLFGVRPDLHVIVPDFEVHYVYAAASGGAVVYLNQRASDCGPTSVDVRVLVPPSNGELRVERHPLGNNEPSSGLPTNSPDGTFWGRSDPRGHCDPNKLPALWIRYIPAAGFAGADFASVEIQDGADVWRGKLWLQVRQ